MSPVTRSSVAAPQSRELRPSDEASEDFEWIDAAPASQRSALDWRRDHRDWAERRPGEPLSGNALCRLLAELADQVRRRGRSLPHGLLRHVMACVDAAPAIPLVIDRRGWPDILLAREALTARLLTAAIAPEDFQSAIPRRFDTLLRQLQTLETPTRRSHQTIQLVKPAEVTRFVDENDAFAAALHSSAKEIRRSRAWSGLGGEFSVRAVTSLPGWPTGRALSIEDRTGRERDRYGTEAPGSTPVRVRLHAAHYDAIVDGNIVPVPSDGDCFYSSVLAGMDAGERRTLLKSSTDDENQQRLILRGLVADHVEAMARRPSTAPEMMRHVWIANAT
ncbi:hypothetical protein [Roseateles sp.]|uniref:hypothetical protein n=1 Tax=Roseateles sp. TaxID=1971397 RepID=UPI002F3EC5DC